MPRCDSTPPAIPAEHALQNSATPPSAAQTFRIVGYVTDTETVIGQIQFDKLTHINYAFLIPKEDGTFFEVANTWKLKEVVAKAHELFGLQYL